jgi:hypothetical protein
MAAAFGLAMAACGGGGDGGERARIQGAVSNASTAAVERDQGWLAWASERVFRIVQIAFAQTSDTSLGGITVTVTSANGSASDETDATGNFTVSSGPTGDVDVRFRRDTCDQDVPLDDVTDGSTITLDSVTFDCSGATPASVHETFRAVVRNVPESPNGNVNACVRSGGQNRTRIVKLKNDPTITGGTLAEGDLIDVDGDREGRGENSAVVAETIAIVGRGTRDECSGTVFTPTETPVPDASPTPTAPAATPTPTPAP